MSNGTWTCTAAGIPLGTLVLEDETYVFTDAGGKGGPGALSDFGEGFEVVDGPLFDKVSEIDVEEGILYLYQANVDQPPFAECLPAEA